MKDIMELCGSEDEKVSTPRVGMSLEKVCSFRKKPEILDERSYTS